MHFEAKEKENLLDSLPKGNSSDQTNENDNSQEGFDLEACDDFLPAYAF